MKNIFLALLTVSFLTPAAFAGDISTDSATWRENYKKAQAAIRLKDYAEAATCIEKALAAAKNFKPNDSRVFASISVQMEVDGLLKDSAKYDEHANEQEAAYEKAFGPNYGLVGLLEGYRAMSLDRHNKPVEAEKSYKKSISILEQAVGADDPTVADNYHHLSVLQWEMGNPTDALQSIQKEDAILSKMKPLNDDKVRANISMQRYIYESLNMPKEAQIAVGKLNVIKAKLENSAYAKRQNNE